MIHKRDLGMLMALSLATSAAFPLGSKEPVPEKPVSLGVLKGPTGIGAVRLFESPPVLAEGIAFKVEAVPQADIMAAKLLSGELDMAVLPVNMAAKLRNSGLRYSAAAVVGNGMVSLLTVDPSITTLADLEGRDVYVAGQGATPEYVFRVVLKRAGIDPETDLRLVFSMPYPEIAASLVAGRIAVAILPEPFTTLAKLGNRLVRTPIDLGALWTEATGLKDYPMSVIVVRDELARTNPKLVAAILAAYRESISWVKASPAEAGAAAEKHDLGLKAAVAAAAIPASKYVFETALEARREIEGILSVFLEAAPGSVGGRLPQAEFYGSYGK